MCIRDSSSTARGAAADGDASEASRTPRGSEGSVGGVDVGAGSSRTCRAGGMWRGAAALRRAAP
eukprot:6129902-Prymnesium_polylepis.1